MYKIYPSLDIFIIFQMLSVFLFLIIFQKTNQYLLLPISTYHPDNFTAITNSKNLSLENFINYLYTNDLYTYVYVGTPPTKIYTYIHTQKSEFYMDNSVCVLPSKYNNESSSTFCPTSNYIVSYDEYNNMCFANETFQDNTGKIMKNINFIYASNPKQNITGFSCLHMGLQLNPIYFNNFMETFIDQLKKLDYIESKYWTIDFSDNENGNLLIGIPPHKYNGEKYNENNIRTCVAEIIEKSYYGEKIIYWGLIFDKIYFNSDNGTEISLLYKKCIFDYGINYIEGSNEYLNYIEKIFFNKYYENKICFKEENIISLNNGRFTIIWCTKEIDVKSFPKINLLSQKIEYNFELDYEDLFLIKDEKIFFKIVFREKRNKFTFGKIFLQKYFFTYSFDNRIIGFYNKVLNKNQTSYNIKQIIIIVLFFCLLIGVIIVGVYLFKKYILNKKNKRINEIDDNYDYMLGKEENENTNIN